ncbi:Rv1476 family membrane protein [Corynebacterium sp. 335C]
MPNRPPEFNADLIREQLAQDRVAATDPKLDVALQGVVVQAHDKGVGELRIVVLDWQPEGDHVTRDLAQQILAQDGGTVVVRAPGELVAVSEDFPRAALENAQLEGMETWDYTMGMSDFVDALAEWSMPYTGLNLIALGVLAILAVGLPLVWWTRARAQAQAEVRAEARAERRDPGDGDTDSPGDRAGRAGVPDEAAPGDRPGRRRV